MADILGDLPILSSSSSGYLNASVGDDDTFEPIQNDDDDDNDDDGGSGGGGDPKRLNRGLNPG